MITDPDKSGQSDLPNGKTLFEGKEYDYIFNIDIDDNVVLKMPYNNDQVRNQNINITFLRLRIKKNVL